MFLKLLFAFCLGSWSCELFPFYWWYKVPGNPCLEVAYGFPLPFNCNIQLVSSGDHRFQLFYFIIDLLFFMTSWFFILYVIGKLLAKTKVHKQLQSKKHIVQPLMLVLLLLLSTCSFYLLYMIIASPFDMEFPWFDSDAQLIKVSFWR